MSSNDLIYRIAIGLLPKIGPILGRNLIAYLGSVEAVFKTPRKQLIKVPGIGELIANQIATQDVLDRAALEIEFIEKHHIRPLFYLDADYPARLNQCDDGPLMIYTLGNANLNNKRVISIVGTRNASTQGKEICEKLIEGLAGLEHKPLIVSGLAYGIDICAHKAALKNDLATAGVLAHGLHMVYPSVHRETATEMLGQGALISEFISHTKPDPKYFVQRNRIVAGLADATVVVESGVKGGALITAELAGSYHRDVFAIPGRPGDKLSAGCNYLIKKNIASLIENAEDIAFLLGWESKLPKKTSVQTALFRELSSDEKKIVDILRQEGSQAIDTLAFACGMPVSRLSALLFTLEMEGVVKKSAGDVFTACQ